MVLNVEETIDKLTLDEKISLLAGGDTWHTVAIDRLNVPSIRTSDGPNGIAFLTLCQLPVSRPLWGSVPPGMSICSTKWESYSPRNQKPKAYMSC